MSNIGKIQYPTIKQEYKVLVRCFTFNHSKYIEDALKGFAMQQTNFPFVCLVMDDASTDGEQEVIKAWMERECDMGRAETIDIPTSVVIIVPHKTNASCSFAFYLLKQNLYKEKEEKMRHVTPWREKCEYEAMCEGDDYWIDSLKLQKQVDFLEMNNDFVLIGGNAKIITCDEKFLRLFSTRKTGKVSAAEIIKEWSFPTAGMLFRTSVIHHIPYIKDAPQGDVIIQLTCAHMGKCQFDNNVVCAYRWLTPGSFTERVRKDQLNYYVRHYSMWVALNEYFEGKYNEYIQQKLKEIRLKIFRERVFKIVPGLQFLRSFYRKLRGY